MLGFILSFSLKILKQNSENLTGIESQSLLVKKATTSNAAREISALLSSPALLPLHLCLRSTCQARMYFAGTAVGKQSVMCRTVSLTIL